jgi:uncharacterized protein YoxC
MTAYPEVQRDDDNRLPELIQAQIGKLNELDEGVKKALADAELAKASAQKAHEQSADRGFFTDKKKVAIEELQQAGIALAKAVTSGTEAQKLSFEMQKRLADVTKYLFTLGVSNIAANRTVVRELEMRLRSASEEELSELARTEVLSVIKQLKEQEDLLRKQDQMGRTLGGHDTKISHLLDQTDDLGQAVKEQEGRYHALAETVGTLQQESGRQQADLSSLQKQSLAQQFELEALGTGLARVDSRTLAESQEWKLRLQDQKAQQAALATLLESLEQSSQSRQQEIKVLRQNIVEQQKELEQLRTASAQAGSQAEQSIASLRSGLNMRTALLAIWVIAMSVVIYFLFGFARA